MERDRNFGLFLYYRYHLIYVYNISVIAESDYVILRLLKFIDYVIIWSQGDCSFF